MRVKKKNEARWDSKYWAFSGRCFTDSGSALGCGERLCLKIPVEQRPLYEEPCALEDEGQYLTL